MTRYRPRCRARLGGRLDQRWIAAIAAGVALIVMSGAAHDEPAAAAPAVAAAPAAAAAAVAGAVTVCTTGDGAPAGPVGQFKGQQLVYAAAIVAAGREMGIPEHGQVIAVATAMQESGLKQYANRRVPESMSIPHEAVGADHLSVGLFQQQPWWGPIPTLMDPRGSARLFYAGLVKVPGWERMAVTRAAQAVQRSDHPDRYAKWEGVARDVAAATAAGITCTEKRS